MQRNKTLKPTLIYLRSSIKSRIRVGNGEELNISRIHRVFNIDLFFSFEVDFIFDYRKGKNFIHIVSCKFCTQIYTE